MKNGNIINRQACSIFRQVSMFIVCSFFTHTLMARDLSFLMRKPASVPDEEVMLRPASDRPILLKVFADDDAGIMAGMRNSLASWEEQEEYAKKWNLASTGLYRTPSTLEKKQMIANKLLKYADKRLAGEIRNADEGSTLHTVGKVEKSLRPNAEVNVSKYFSVKFKARVLQGKAIMELRNPWVECSTTASATGNVKVLTKKDFKEIGLSSGLEYTANNSDWTAFADQQITENIKARFSSIQKDQSFFNHDAEKRIEMTASFPLNL